MTDLHSADAHPLDYEPPSLTGLGTLADLTQGLGEGAEDAIDGFENSTPPT